MYRMASMTASRSQSNHAAEQPFEASLGQKSLERRHDTLPEHPDRIARFRAAMAQSALDQAGHGLGRGRSGYYCSAAYILEAIDHVVVRTRTRRSPSWPDLWS